MEHIAGIQAGREVTQQICVLRRVLGVVTSRLLGSAGVGGLAVCDGGGDEFHIQNRTI